LCINRAATQIRVGGKLDIEKHRKQIRSLVAEAPDEPTNCEFKEKLSYATKREKGELVKDVSPFANANLEALGGYGYIIFGVSNNGRVVGVRNIAGDPPSDARQIVNGHLERPVVFEYFTCEVDDNAGGKKRVAAIVVPDSRRRPHVVSREIKEVRSNNRDTFWLRKGEVWVRKAGGRELATAEDLDTMYEGTMRRLVDDQVRPLQQRVERIERDLSERTGAIPKVGFGFAVSKSREPAPEKHPYPVLGNLIEADGIEQEIERARKRAAEDTETVGLDPRFGVVGSAFRPAAEEYEGYAQRLRKWFTEVQDLFFVDFVFANTGGAPAEDVQVVLQMPAKLKPKKKLPVRPAEPSRDPYGVRAASLGLWDASNRSRAAHQPRPDRIIGPRIQNDASGIAAAVWEVPTLYHDRPLFTRSMIEPQMGINGLLISGKGLRGHQSQAGAGAQLNYTVRAANVPEAVHGVLIVRNEP
jgi:hypothetical protein